MSGPRPGRRGPCHQGGAAEAPADEAVIVGRLEYLWQRDQLPETIRPLVLDDQHLRNEICWSAFDI
jgi:hypothetical protein